MVLVRVTPLALSGTCAEAPTIVVTRLLCLVRAAVRRSNRAAHRPVAELWCRPATLLALRNREHATNCIAGWR
jgi:hypothetical protein